MGCLSFEYPVTGKPFFSGEPVGRSNRPQPPLTWPCMQDAWVLLWSIKQPSIQWRIAVTSLSCDTANLNRHKLRKPARRDWVNADASREYRDAAKLRKLQFCWNKRLKGMCILQPNVLVDLITLCFVHLDSEYVKVPQTQTTKHSLQARGNPCTVGYLICIDSNATSCKST